MAIHEKPTKFWVLLVGKQYARLFSRDQSTLIEIVTPLKDTAGNPLQGFPLDNLPPADKYKEAAGKGDRGDSYVDAEIKHFFQLVDQELQKTTAVHGVMPVILCGTPEYIKLFKITTHHPKIIALEIPRDYNTHQKSPEHLKKDVAEAIAVYHDHQEEVLFKEFEDAMNTRRQACGITYVWEMASTGRVHKLLIEPNLSQVGRVNPENPANLQIFPEKGEASLQLISDILIDETLRHGGEVYVVKKDSLKKCEGVGAIMRY